MMNPYEIVYVVCNFANIRKPQDELDGKAYATC